MRQTRNKSVASLKSLFDSEDYMYFESDLFLRRDQTDEQARFLLKYLSIAPRTRLLDLGCGNGRHSIALATQVRSGVGIDFNLSYIQAARKIARANRLGNLKFHHRDMRRLAYDRAFDSAIMVGIFGIFGDEENLSLLRQIHKSLVPNGLLCFNVINRDTILTEFTPDFIYDKHGDLLLDRCSFDPVSGRIVNDRIYIRKGRRRDVRFSLRTYNYSEMVAIMHCAKFRIREVYGDWGGAAFVAASKKLIVVAEKQ